MIVLVLGGVACAVFCPDAERLNAWWRRATVVTPGTYLLLDLKTGVAETTEVIRGDVWNTADKTDLLVLRQIEPGTFEMGGADDSESLILDDCPRHRVTLTRGFAIGVFEVTRGQWRQIMGTGVSDDLPVGNVTWKQAATFLAALERRFPTYAFSLPTEAEWEYACRAGGASPEADAWEKANAKGRAHPVGLREPNAWGLHDMCGNVWEWCQDAEYAYTVEPAVDPVHPPQPGRTPLLVARGGSWCNQASVCSPTHRAFFVGEIDVIPMGLRVVCRPKER